MSSQIIDRVFPAWQLPVSQNGENKEFAIPKMYIYDLDSLFQRGALYGFQCIVYLMRKAEIENNNLAFLEYLKFAYRAFPGLCRYRYFTHRWPQFLDALIRLHSRVPLTVMIVSPNRKVIKRQIENKKHVLRRGFTLQGERTFSHQAHEEPFYSASFN